MPTRKEDVYLAFIKGMDEWTRKEERLYDKRLAEMKERRNMPTD